MSQQEPSPSDPFADEPTVEEMVAEMIANVDGHYVVIADSQSAAESGEGIVFDLKRRGWMGIDGHAGSHENLVKKMVAAGTKVFDSLDAAESGSKAKGKAGT